MTIEEQQILKRDSFAEAMRYIDNAKETLKKAGKEGKFYTDDKYVKTAYGTAYHAILIALKTYLELKGIKSNKKDTQDIQYFRFKLGALDKKLLKDVNIAYSLIHVCGYCEGNPSICASNESFELAYKIINKIKP